MNPPYSATLGKAFDADDFDTLQPSSRTSGMNLNVARPLGGVSASLSLNAMRTTSNGLSGIPWITLVLPAGSPWSLDGAPVTLERAFNGTRALRSQNSAESLGGSLSLTGRIWGVQTDLVISMSNSTSSNLVETGVAVASLQRRLDDNDAAFDPFGPIGVSFLQASRSRSRATSTNIRLNLQKAFLQLPAGEVSWSLGASVSRSHSLVSQIGTANSLSSSFSQAMSAEQISVNIPISRTGSAFALFGNLDADFSFNRQSMGGSGAALSYGSGLGWIPLRGIEVRGALDRMQIVPASDQLNGPLVTTVSRIFDYSRLETIDISWTIGGNPLLRPGRQSGLTLTMAVKPLVRQDLSLSVGYRRSSARNASTAFPELTPDIEAAFPERVVRDAAGKLLSVDARSISVARQDDAVLTSGISLRLTGRRSASRRTRPLPARNPLQTNLALTYQLQLASKSLIRPGLPVIDWLAESGTSRHSATFRLNVGKRAFGSSLNATWKSASFITSPDETLRRTSPVVFDLTSFLNLEYLVGTRGSGWSRGLKFSLDIHNALNSYPRVALPDGRTPDGYLGGDIDPLGRTVRIAIRKQF
ncbi:hypothetical protein HZY97_08265 [Sphingomonas sp. R-74633]|uniref:hypothetical protein n=1 Tax=Sphingomonas sp. R-74633 TaxID=2751188 RepID=UPI0015D4477E|nr:hypothetical protein [Sphingomonas sp. R-74633]NYT40748.1 hypothetical protein [Sphingomonas sp. R-74633]